MKHPLSPTQPAIGHSGLVPTGFPSKGLGFGGNDVRPIRWWPWLLAALVCGLVFGGQLGTTVGGVGGTFLGTLVGAGFALAMLMHPIRQRDYRFPEPAALRVAPDGLYVHLGEHGRWRPGRYLHLPWPAIAEVNLVEGPLSVLTSPSLSIRLTAAGHAMISQLPASARRVIGADGFLVVPQIVSIELLHALTHYSDGQIRVGPP